jgi:hypothetical protein
LGASSYDPESETGDKRPAFADQQLRLSVSGELEPDPALLEPVARLQAELPALVAKLPAFLEHEAVQVPEFAMEIRSLKLEDMAVRWPKQPEAVSASRLSGPWGGATRRPNLELKLTSVEHIGRSQLNPNGRRT